MNCCIVYFILPFCERCKSLTERQNKTCFSCSNFYKWLYDFHNLIWTHSILLMTTGHGGGVSLQHHKKLLALSLDLKQTNKQAKQLENKQILAHSSHLSQLPLQLLALQFECSSESEKITRVNISCGVCMCAHCECMCVHAHTVASLSPTICFFSASPNSNLSLSKATCFLYCFWT